MKLNRAPLGPRTVVFRKTAGAPLIDSQQSKVSQAYEGDRVIDIGTVNGLSTQTYPHARRRSATWMGSGSRPSPSIALAAISAKFWRLERS